VGGQTQHKKVGCLGPCGPLVPPPMHLAHAGLTCPSSATTRRLKSRHPFVPAAQQHISSSDNRSPLLWADHHGMRSDWTTLRNSVLSSLTSAPTLLEQPFQGQRGLTASALVSDVLTPAYTNMAPSAACECGAKEQTAYHVVLQCPIHWPHRGLHVLTVLDDETIDWLLNILILRNGNVLWTTLQGVSTLNGARGKTQVWRSHVRT